MPSENEKLRALLAEAQTAMALNFDRYACAMCSRDQSPKDCRCGMKATGKLVDRIDAALAEPVVAEYSQDDVNAMTTDMIALRKEYEKNAYQRGAEVLREAAAAAVHDCHTTGLLTPAAVTRAVRVIRALPVPEDTCAD